MKIIVNPKIVNTKSGLWSTFFVTQFVTLFYVFLFKYGLFITYHWFINIELAANSTITHACPEYI